MRAPRIASAGIFLASVAAMATAACTEEPVSVTADCASLLAQYDQGARGAPVDHVSAARAAREVGERLCLEGKTKEGTAKLVKAIRQISAGVRGVAFRQ